MENITVEIIVPAISKSYDFQIPTSNYMCDIVTDLILIIETSQQNVIFDRSRPMLCDPERGITLDPDIIVADSGIRDGTSLLLL